jgi:hypothetical protein
MNFRESPLCEVRPVDWPQPAGSTMRHGVTALQEVHKGVAGMLDRMSPGATLQHRPTAFLETDEPRPPGNAPDA